jgi:hypothetical protein
VVVDGQALESSFECMHWTSKPTDLIQQYNRGAAREVYD